MRGIWNGFPPFCTHSSWKIASDKSVVVAHALPDDDVSVVILTYYENSRYIAQAMHTYALFASWHSAVTDNNNSKNGPAFFVIITAAF